VLASAMNISSPLYEQLRSLDRNYVAVAVKELISYCLRHSNRAWTSEQWRSTVWGVENFLDYFKVALVELIAKASKTVKLYYFATVPLLLPVDDYLIQPGLGVEW